MNNSSLIENVNAGVSEAARIVGLTNPNLISVWVSRGFIKPDQISVLTEKRKLYGLSFKNLVELRLLVELQETYSLGYKVTSRILFEAFGPDRQRLTQLINGTGAYLVIGKSYKSDQDGVKYWDITRDECKKLKKNEAFQVKLIKTMQKIEEIGKEFDYLMIADLGKVIERLKKRI